MSNGWRVWFAFEARPGITIVSTQDNSELWRCLANACRASDGKVDTVEFEYWADCLVEHAHLWGTA